MTQLWIALKLYLWNIADIKIGKKQYGEIVVNCSQIVSLKYCWHPKIKWDKVFEGCELLSNCIFEILLTSYGINAVTTFELWIALKLYLWNIADIFSDMNHHYVYVVNCSQIVSLKYCWHPGWTENSTVWSCELLSNCIFEILLTSS